MLLHCFHYANEFLWCSAILCTNHSVQFVYAETWHWEKIESHFFMLCVIAVRVASLVRMMIVDSSNIIAQNIQCMCVRYDFGYYMQFKGFTYKDFKTLLCSAYQESLLQKRTLWYYWLFVLFLTLSFYNCDLFHCSNYALIWAWINSIFINLKFQ
jgi:uncharacterized membrane protein